MKKPNGFPVRHCGGTPTVLSAENLDRILKELSYPSVEFTVEAGRADTITKEKLEVLKNNKVTRICVNPPNFLRKNIKINWQKPHC